MSETAFRLLLAHLTLQIVEAYAARHETASDATLQRLMEIVHNSLAGVCPGVAEEAQPTRALQAGQTGQPEGLPRGVYGDHIVCFEDGRKLKMLKRYLLSRYNLTPDEYRQKWNLPISYPMVAPDYAALRSAVAVKHGLGRKPQRLAARRLK